VRRALGWATMLVAVALALAACDGPVTEASPRAEVTATLEVSATPEEAVRRLLAALDEGRFDTAAGLVPAGQWSLVALAEGAELGDVADVYASGGLEVGTNFWAGFTSGVSDTLGAGPGALRIGEVRRFGAGGRSFAEVSVYQANDASFRRIVTIEEDGGWAVDVVASFAEALVPRLAQEADKVLSTAGRDASTVLEALREAEPSFRAVASLDGVSPELLQAAVIAVEAITR